MKYRDQPEILEFEFSGGGARLESSKLAEFDRDPLPNCSDQGTSMNLPLCPLPNCSEPVTDLNCCVFQFVPSE